ncbi:hypothetical protein HDU85_002014 [Gaertneriomyces sp. JEL0708]|nr:hypothetical protein HDU85_002014 [Gaertneriomyces sp. JEL0708]
MGLTGLPLPPLPKDQRKVLLVYIHGFLGSEESFFNFPNHLIDRLVQEYDIPRDRLESRFYPRYDTSGDNGLAVRKLYDWLILHATTGRYDYVILLAHSMGGLLAADVYRYMYAKQRGEVDKWMEEGREEGGIEGIGVVASEPSQELPIEEKKSTWWNPFNGLGRMGAGVRSNNAENVAKEPTLRTSPEILNNVENLPSPPVAPKDVVDETRLSDSFRAFVNIRAILTFDSPFFGLHANLITQAGPRSAVALMSDAGSYVPILRDAVTDLVPDKVEVPVGIKQLGTVPVRTSWVMAAASKLAGGFNGTQQKTGDSSESATFQTDRENDDSPNSASSTPSGIPGSDALPADANDILHGTADAEDLATEAAPATFAAGVPLWAKYALAGTALAATAYVTLPVAVACAPGMLTFAAARTIAITSAEVARRHLSFLYPLISSELFTRVEMLRRESEDTGQLSFHGFFLALPKFGDPQPSSIKLDEGTGRNNDLTGRRHFCNPPSTAVHLFEPIAHPLQNQIDAHMHIFDDAVGKDWYNSFVDRTAELVKVILDKESRRASPTGPPRQ